MKGYLLALDAAYGKACTCLIAPDGSAFTAESTEDRPHSQAVLPLLESVMDRAGIQWSELDCLAVGQGPGMFTGIRIAAATMAGINAEMQKPMLGICSLAITAMQADVDDEVWTIEDARAGDVYIGCYRRGETISVAQCLPLEKVTTFSPAIMTGQQPVNLPHWQQLPLQMSRAKAMAAIIHHQFVNGGQTFDTLPCEQQPIYLQPSQAERNLHP
ncbi:MAG: tRNA (adenosine(37)-N6)-threonylcarbamoyltransferase complex dimerization subunit type 1 TsaB [Mariprofundaceae bacterium]